MAAQQRYSKCLDKSTFDAGYTHILKRMDRQYPSYLDLIDWQIELDNLPRGERSNFSNGQLAAIHDAMARMEERALLAGDDSYRFAAIGA